MAKDEINIEADGVTFTITGYKETLRDLRNAGSDAEDMRDLIHEIGMLVVHTAKPPVQTGSLAASLRAGRGKTKAVVRAGRASVPYAGPIHWGWPARNIKPNPFLAEARDRTMPAIVNRLNEGLGEILKKNGLR